jgi:putative hemolysin
MIKDRRLLRVLVFAPNTFGADKISQRLKRAGVVAISIHSGHTKNQRKRALDGFRSGKYQVMVTTDIAARSIDIEEISHVINYTVPTKVENYVHRIRRVEASGDAITFVSSEEEKHLSEIGKFIGRKLKAQKCNGFSYVKSIKTRRIAVRNSHYGWTNIKGQIMHRRNTFFNLSMTEKRVTMNLGDSDKFTTRLLYLFLKPGLRLIHFDRLETKFKALASDPRPSDLVFQKCLDHLSIDVDFNRQQLARIPSEGPLIVVAPHKLVAVDGLAIASAIMPVRKDLKIMALSYLRAMPEIGPYIIPVKEGNSKRAKRRNLSAFWKAKLWLKDGHTLLVFPSGQIAMRKPLWNPHVVESKWRNSLALLIKGSRANVLPVFVHGQTSLAFQIVRRIHPWTERLLSPGELLSKENQTIRLAIGDPILYNELKTIGSGSVLVDNLRKMTYDLEHQA